MYGFDEAEQCNTTIHGGLYSRDFDRCCKGEHLTDNYIFSNDYDCRVKVPVENPNDDLSTSMVCNKLNLQFIFLHRLQ